MKKLMFATALVASAVAFADPLNAISFENAAYANIENATNLSARADRPDPGREDTGTYFLFTGGDSDSSVVTNVAAAFTDGKVTAYYAGLENYSNQKFLALDTEGGTLWRSINTLGGNNDELGEERTVAGTGTYLDTLVQFTVTEDEEPTVDTGSDKLAIWLGVVTNAEGAVTGTNLMVKAKGWALEGGAPNGVPTTFTVDNVSVEPGTWYRLTVKAIQTVLKPEFGAIMPAFQIYIDGTEAVATAPQVSADMQSMLTGGDVWIEGMATLASANKLFPTLAEDPNALTDVTLQGVGFQGTGAVDEIVWTDDNPFSASGVDFTLTWDANVTAVSYTIDGTTTDLSSETSPYTITGLAADTAVTVNANALDWYVISSGTGVVTAVAGGTNEIVAVLAATPGDAGATGLPASITTANAKAWADAKNLTPAQIAACTFAEKAYLLNTDLTVEPTFAISAIEEVEDGWKITVEAKTGSTLVDLEEIRGTLKVKTGATLEALASATSETIPTANLTFDAAGKAEIKITGTGKNFIKATVE